MAVNTNANGALKGVENTALQEALTGTAGGIYD